MIASEILAKGVERGIITAEQAERLHALENAGEPPELPVSPDDEQLRFISGFSDIFVTIGLALFIGAVGYFALSSNGPVGMWIAVAVTAWLLAEFFTRLRRMALPSIVLLIVFAWAAFAASAVFLGADAGLYSRPLVAWAFQTWWVRAGDIGECRISDRAADGIALLALSGTHNHSGGMQRAAAHGHGTSLWAFSASAARRIQRPNSCLRSRYFWLGHAV